MSAVNPGRDDVWSAGDGSGRVTPAPARPGGLERVRLAKLRRVLIVAVPAGAGAIAAGLVLAGLPDYARNVAFEQNAMTWVQSVVMVLVGFLAASLAVRRWLAGGRPWLWALVSAGFIVVAVDEQFIVHERIRDEVLSGLPRVLPWAAPGEVLTLLYAIGGIALAVGVLREMRVDRAARRALLAGGALVLLTLAVDTIDATSMSYETLLVEQTAEEIGELLALSSMLLGLLLFALGRPHHRPVQRRSSPRSLDEHLAAEYKHSRSPAPNAVPSE